MVGVQVQVAQVAALRGELELVSDGAVDVLGPEILERVAALTVAGQRAADRGALDEALQVVCRHALRILATAERIDFPSFLAVV